MKDAVEIIAEQFRRLPGIGIKSARRLAYFMLERPQEDVDTFLNTIKEARAHSCYCSICGNLSTSDPCPICSDDSRDQHTLCVVEQPPDVQAMEKSQEYHGTASSPGIISGKGSNHRH